MAATDMRIRFNVRVMLFFTFGCALFLAANTHLNSKTTTFVRKIRISPERLQKDLELPEDCVIYSRVRQPYVSFGDFLLFRRQVKCHAWGYFPDGKRQLPSFDVSYQITIAGIGTTVIER